MGLSSGSRFRRGTINFLVVDIEEVLLWTEKEQGFLWLRALCFCVKTTTITKVNEWTVHNGTGDEPRDYGSWIEERFVRACVLTHSTALRVTRLHFSTAK